jgi:hypothetical protein
MANNNDNSQQRKVTFELAEHICVFDTKESGWKKEANIVAWNGGNGKLDIREWNPEHTRMSKGITLSEEEAEKLTRLLAKRYKIGGEAPAPGVFDHSSEAGQAQTQLQA